MIRLFLLFTFGLVMQLSLAQTTLETRLDFLVDHSSLAEALQELSRITDLPIAFSDPSLNRSKRRSYHFRQKKLKDILQQLLANTQLDYQWLGDQIILHKKKIIPKYTINGYIQAASDGEKLIAATLYSPQHRQGTVSNEYGFYSITLPAGETELYCNYLGSNEKKLVVDLRQDQFLKIELDQSITLEAVEVRPQHVQDQQLFHTSPNSNELAIGQLHRIPDLGGESDLLRATHLLPGVQTGADGLGGLHIRGGNADQNLLLLDGVPIYNANHLLGVFSVFNTSAIRKAKLIKGAFPARYGGRLSSVYDVRTREGNEKHWQGEAGTSLVSAKATLEGPLVEEKISLLVSGRRSFNPFLFDSIARSVFYPGLELPLGYHFFDLNTKVNYSISEKDRLFFSYYWGGDRLSTFFEDDLISNETEAEEIFYSRQNQLSWGNHLASLRWNHLFNPRLFANTTFTFSDYNYRNSLLTENEIYNLNTGQETDEYEYQEYASNIQDWALVSDWDFLPNPQHYIRFGLGLTMHLLRPSIFYAEGSTDELNVDSLTLDAFEDFSPVLELEALEFHAYAEDDFYWGEKWHLNYGLRLSGFKQEDSWFFNPEPRLGLRYQLTPTWALHLGGSRMVQYLHRIAPVGLSRPDDVWIPASESILPQKAWQGGLTLAHHPSKTWQWSIETYWKHMDHLISYDDFNINALEEETLEDQLIIGQGRSWGLEGLLQKNQGKTGGHLAYSLAWSRRQFDDLNLGNEYPFIYDRRHQIALFGYHRFNRQWEFSVSWLYGSAQPTLIVEDDVADGITRVLFDPEGDRNGFRDQDYHRLDLSLRYQLHRPRFQHDFKIGIYNTYNRPNQAFLRIAETLPSGRNLLQPVSFLPTLPSFSYTLRLSPKKKPSPSVN